MAKTWFKHRHMILLDIIARSTKPVGDKTLYFVPARARPGNWSEILRESIYIGGSGDAAILRKFEREGLTVNAHSPINPYCCRVTPVGREFLEIAKTHLLTKQAHGNGEKL